MMFLNQVNRAQPDSIDYFFETFIKETSHLRILVKNTDRILYRAILSNLN